MVVGMETSVMIFISRSIQVSRKSQWKLTWPGLKKARKLLIPEGMMDETPEVHTHLPEEMKEREVAREEVQEAITTEEEDPPQDSLNILMTRPLVIRSLRCQMCHRETQYCQEVLHEPRLLQIPVFPPQLPDLHTHVHLVITSLLHPQPPDHTTHPTPTPQTPRCLAVSMTQEESPEIHLPSSFQIRSHSFSRSLLCQRRKEGRLIVST